MKVALVYDRVNKWGGAERVLLALHKIFPDAPLFTSVYEPRKASWAKVFNVKTSFLQKFSLARNNHELLAVLMPFVFESFSFDKYDLVISVTSESAKGIMTGPGTLHLCICLTPTRYLWSGHELYFNNRIFRALTLPIVWTLRLWDMKAARRPDKIIAISDVVKDRIKKYYGLDSYRIYPPLYLNHKTKTGKKRAIDKLKPKSYFLVVSRLVPYKKVDLAVKAATRLNLPLKVIGIGSEFAKLKAIAGPTVEFLGQVDDTVLYKYYKNAIALIFSGIEDFGLVMVEAQSFGIPVIAYSGGGAREIVINGKTGVFFNKQTVGSLIQVLKKFKNARYNSRDCIKNAERFSFKNFKDEFMHFLKEAKTK